MGIVSVSLSDALLEEIDAVVDQHDYSGRSEAFREAGRKFVREFEDPKLCDRDLIAVVTALFPYDSPSVEKRLRELRHDHDDVVRTNAHSCVRKNRGCVETFVVEGTLTTVGAFVRDLESSGEVVHVEYSVYPVDDIHPSVP